MNEVINISELSSKEHQALACLYFAKLSEADPRYSKMEKCFDVFQSRFNLKKKRYYHLKEIYDASFDDNGRNGLMLVPVEKTKHECQTVYNEYKDFQADILEKAVDEIIELYSTESESFVSMKCGFPETVHKLLSGIKDATIDGVYTLQEKLKKGQIVFVTIGGDKSKREVDWQPGFFGVGHVAKEPYNFGYDGRPKYYMFDIHIDIVFDNVYRREDFIHYEDAFDAAYIGPELSRDATQALSSLSDDKAVAVIRAVLDKEPLLLNEFKKVFSEEFMERVLGATQMLFPLIVDYKDNIVDAVRETYLNIQTDETTVHNEYKRAADYLKAYVSETDFDIPTKKEEVEAVLMKFNAKYSPEILEALPDDKLLSYIFYTQDDNRESLCYWLEFDKECRNCFGSIASNGNRHIFGLYQKQDTGEWTTGSSKKPEIITEREALDIGRNIRNALVCAAKIVRKSNLTSIEDYEKLDAELLREIGKPYYGWVWFHKYLSLACPDKLSGFHTDDWQKHVLYSLRIRPCEGRFARSGQIAMVENYADWYCVEMRDVLYERFGDKIIEFVRIGTSDEDRNYASEWRKKSVVGIGWRKIGSLEGYMTGEGLDKTTISKALKEKYPNKDNIESRKAGELIRFYKTNANTVMVAMDGETLIALADNIGSYFYDSASAMSNMKHCTWHNCFLPNEKLPEKSEGKNTSCYPLSKEDNLLYLYEKYYYSDEKTQAENFGEEDPEERNKRGFRIWMKKQVKSEEDSDAGNPYSEKTIEQYVSSISNTPLPSDEEHSVFFTLGVDDVKKCIDTLEELGEETNKKVAVKQYLNYLMELEEENMPLVFNTNLRTKYKHNRIIFGAPGTGKSYILNKERKELLGDDNEADYERVTFHPDYSYANFVGTYKPTVIEDEDGKEVITYEYVPGPFMRVYVNALRSARSDNPKPHLLIIEEINRANVAAVFGDVFQLLDRDENGVSEYPIQATEDMKKYLAKELGGNPEKYSKIRIPNNMFIWATMNSADQGVFPVDTAFKRRWNFTYIGIDDNDEDIRGKYVTVGNKAIQRIDWNSLRKAINNFLAGQNINEDKQLGPYFLAREIVVPKEGDEINRDAFADAFKSKVIMYLFEDAAKQRRNTLFGGCKENTSEYSESCRYSDICKKFDENGIYIFDKKIQDETDFEVLSY